MDNATNKALRFISDNPELAKGIGAMAEAFRRNSMDSGTELSREVLAGFIFDSFVEITSVNGHSPFADAAMMNVVMAIADSSGFDL